MHKVDEVIERLRACANGLGSFKDERGDLGLCDTAADLLASMKEALEEIVSIFDSKFIPQREGLRRIEKAARNALNGEKNGHG